VNSTFSPDPIISCAMDSAIKLLLNCYTVAAPQT